MPVRLIAHPASHSKCFQNKRMQETLYGCMVVDVRGIRIEIVEPSRDGRLTDLIIIAT